jgi:hypothetical protein
MLGEGISGREAAKPLIILEPLGLFVILNAFVIIN